MCYTRPVEALKMNQSVHTKLLPRAPLRFGDRFVQGGTRLSRGATKSRTDSNSDSNTYTNPSTGATKDCLTEDCSESSTKCYTSPYIILR